TTSTDFPTAGGGPAKFGGGALGANTDAYVAKLNAGGTALIYSVYLGGSGSEFSAGIAVDGSGSAYGTGLTNSAGSPEGAGGQGVCDGADHLDGLPDGGRGAGQARQRRAGQPFRCVRGEAEPGGHGPHLQRVRGWQRDRRGHWHRGGRERQRVCDGIHQLG